MSSEHNEVLIIINQIHLTDFYFGKYGTYGYEADEVMKYRIQLQRHKLSAPVRKITAIYIMSDCC